MDLFVEQALHALRHDGVSVHPGYLDNELLEAMREEFDRLVLTEEEGVKHIGHNPGRAFRIGLDELGFGGHRLQGSAILTAFDKAPLRELAAALMPDASFCNAIIGTHDFRPIPITDIHFDTHRRLKFMIYLDETTRENGAFSYFPGSHGKNSRYRRIFEQLGGPPMSIPNSIGERKRDRIWNIEGKAGTLIIFDTDGLHAGGIMQSGKSRRVIRAQCQVHEKGDPFLARMMPYRIRHSEYSPAMLYSRLVARGYQATRGMAHSQNNR
jgi:hypothetical protein